MGALADRVRHRWLIAGAMASLAGALVWATSVTPGLSAMAFGPLLFALGRDVTGSYTTVLLASVPLPVVVGVAAFIVRPPRRAGPA